MNNDFSLNDNQNQSDPTQNMNSFGSRLRNFFRAPNFEEDPIRTRKAVILRAFLISLLIITTLYSVVILLTSESPLLGLALVVSVQIFTIISFIALKRGHVEITSIVFVLFLWLLLSTATVLFGDPVNPLLASLILVVFAAGQLISNRAAVFYAVLSVFFAVFLLLLSRNMVLPQYLETDDLVYISRLSIFFILMAFFSVIANRSTSDAFLKVQEAEQAVKESNQELREIQVYLQETVEERTNQLERRNRYLEAAAQVASKSISTLNLDEMMNTIVDEVSHQFGFYHVGIFLIDPQKEWAILRAASSIGGKKMIGRNHRLAVGRQGMVGFVTSIGQARIAQDVELDRVHSITQELPDTRSEMTLPLKARDEIIGALDIQESKPNAFTEEDIAVLQTMADQIALAVENIRLFEQTQATLTEVQRVYGEYSRQAWAETFQKNLIPSYRYSGGSVNQLQNDDESTDIEAKLSIPVKVRGFTIGTIEIAKESETEEWKSEEIKLLETLSDQIGIALDSARLFNETQLRAATEHLIGRINSQLWETMDVNSILMNTAENLRSSLSLPELTIRISSPEQFHTDNGNTGSQELGKSDRGNDD
ncbi:MAG: GAF domain-containing protein [Anaerolineales bacterium]